MIFDVPEREGLKSIVKTVQIRVWEDGIWEFVEREVSRYEAEKEAK